MAKRKAISSSGSEEEYERSSKKSKNSINHSIIQAANFMSKNQALHKSLNLSSSLLLPDGNEKAKKKSKVQKKVVTSESEEEINEQIIPNHNKHEDVNATNSSFKKDRKSKSPKKRNSKDKSYDAFTPRLVPKEEIVEGLEVFDTISPEEDGNLNASSNENNSRHSYSNIEEDDVNMMNSIEEKVQKVRVLQEVRISPSKDPKQQLKNIYPNLQQRHIKTKINLGDSDEIFLFRTPKNVDVQNLLNTSIDLEEGCKINIGEKYIIRPTSKIPHPTLLLSSLSNIFRFKKNIVMEKYMKPPKTLKLPVKEKTVIPLPNDLKNRHPLFGNDFEEKIQLDEAVEKKLSSAIKNLLKQEKKAKKKELQKDLEEEKDELVFSLLETKTVTRKQKPDKNEVPSTPHKSAKKKKMTKNDLIEETLRLMKQELHTEYESDLETSVPKKKKHKKKSHSTIDVNIKQEVGSETEYKEMTPKALRRISLANSTMLPHSSKIDNFNPELSGIAGVFSEELIFTKEKKKKKAKEVPSDVSNGEESIYHLPQSKKIKIKQEHNEGSPVKKKKKKIID